jgi:hypothetical protein
MDIAMSEELKEGIKESKKVLEGFKWFGGQVLEALSALDEIESYVDNPQPENKGRITGIVKEMQARLGGYASFVPVLVETLKKLEAWLETQP